MLTFDGGSSKNGFPNVKRTISMPLDQLVDSILDYFRLPEHKKNASPGTGIRVAPQSTAASQEPQEQAHRPKPSEARPDSAPTAPGGDAPPSSPEHDPIRILLVEDDPKWAKLVQAYVSAINNERTLGLVELDWVETLSSSKGKLSKRSYDLIFLDLMLPDSQGINTLEVVWERAKKVDTPVVVMSNLDSGGVMDRVREVTGRDILLKKNISKRVLFGHIDSNVFED